MLSIKELFQLIDIFASEYGWTIEYIEDLTPYEIDCLLKAIKVRKDIESGTHEKYQEFEEDSERDIKNLRQLVKDGIVKKPKKKKQKKKRD